MWGCSSDSQSIELLLSKDGENCNLDSGPSHSLISWLRYFSEAMHSTWFLTQSTTGACLIQEAKKWTWLSLPGSRAYTTFPIPWRAVMDLNDLEKDISLPPWGLRS